MTTEELLRYYANLLIIQYHNLTKAINTVATYVSEVIADQIVSKVLDAFNLDVAIGSQLDTLGSYRGVLRYYPGVIISRTFWQLVDYTDAGAGTANGFVEYGDPESDYLFDLYEFEIPPVLALTDDEERRLIKFRAKVHSCNFSNKAIDDILFEFFGTNVLLVDNQDMTITYQHLGTDLDTLFDICDATLSLPHPSGVSYTTAII